VNFINENLWLIALAVMSGGALLWPTLIRSGAKVSHLQATQMMNQGKVLVLDVRDTEQFSGGHLRDARNIPLADLGKRVGELDKFKARPVILVCATGVQSARAAAQLRKAGFGEVYILEGGLSAWQAQGLPTAK
jgi:rhodanese-related sulfurtransferase